MYRIRSLHRPAQDPKRRLIGRRDRSRLSTVPYRLRKDERAISGLIKFGSDLSIERSIAEVEMGYCGLENFGIVCLRFLYRTLVRDGPQWRDSW